MTVTNPNRATAVCAECFAVTAKPTVTSLNPASRPAGTSHATIQLTGTGLQDGAAVSVAGTGVSVHSVTFVDATRLDLDVSIDAAASTGGRAVTVVNPDGGSGTKSAAFTVNATPTITTVAPTNLRQGRSLNVVVNGTGFPTNFVAGGGTVSFGDGVAVTAVVRNSSSKLTVSVAVDAAAVPGARTVTVTNPDTGTTTCTSCATVVVDPQITNIAPASRSTRHDGPGHHDQRIGLPTRCRGEAVGYGDHRDGDDGPGPVDRDRAAFRRRLGDARGA